MQNRYFGDVGDFGKYGLLRCLGADHRLGVVWYLVPDESHNNDGKHVSYLRERSAFRDCDPILYEALAGILDSGKRSVSEARQDGVLPTGTLLFEEALTFEGMPCNGYRAIDARIDHRRRWVELAIRSTQEAEVVFLDPDNGIESGTRRHERKGPKYVYFDEVQPYLDQGQSVVLYHHLDRSMNADAQILFRMAQLTSYLKGNAEISALRYRRGSPRAFFLIPAPAHAATLQQNVRRFMESPWSRHFELARSQVEKLPA